MTTSREEWNKAAEYVARARPYILGYLLEAERVRLQAELDECLTTRGNADVIAQRDILRREDDSLWEWKLGVG